MAQWEKKEWKKKGETLEDGKYSLLRFFLSGGGGGGGGLRRLSSSLLILLPSPQCLVHDSPIRQRTLPIFPKWLL